MTLIAQGTHDALARTSAGRIEALESGLALPEAELESTGLDERAFALEFAAQKAKVLGA